MCEFYHLCNNGIVIFTQWKYSQFDNTLSLVIFARYSYFCTVISLVTFAPEVFFAEIA